MTKQRRLPEIDLARVAPLERDEKHRQLSSFNTGGGSWSYGPARKQNFNIVNPRNPMGLSTSAPSLKQIEKLIKGACNCDIQEKSCLEVTRLFYDWRKEYITDAVEINIHDMSIGSMGTVCYWEKFIAIVNDKPTVIFLDHRKGKPLTKAGRKFAFSVMEAQLRSTLPEYADSEKIILQFPQIKKQPRHVITHWAADESLYSLDQLIQMIEETYEVFNIVCQEKGADKSEQKKAAGGLF